MKPGEAEAAALSRKLNKYLAPAEKAETWDVGTYIIVGHGSDSLDCEHGEQW